MAIFTPDFKVFQVGSRDPETPMPLAIYTAHLAYPLF